MLHLGDPCRRRPARRGGERPFRLEGGTACPGELHASYKNASSIDELRPSSAVSASCMPDRTELRVHIRIYRTLGSPGLNWSKSPRSTRLSPEICDQDFLPTGQNMDRIETAVTRKIVRQTGRYFCTAGRGRAHQPADPLGSSKAWTCCSAFDGAPRTHAWGRGRTMIQDCTFKHQA